MAFLTGGNDLHWGIRKVGVFVPLQVTQERDGLEYRFPGLITRVLDRARASPGKTGGPQDSALRFPGSSCHPLDVPVRK
jgi:hypothetical protein